MKIQYLITSLEQGGAQAAIPRITNVLRAYGHQVEVTACEARDLGAAPLLDAAGIDYRLLPTRGKNKLAMIRAYAEIVRQSQPDVIFTSLSKAGLVGAAAGALLGVPVVSWKNAANRRMHTWCLQGMSKLWIADSQSAATFLTHQVGIAGEKVMAWPLFERTTFAQYPEPWDGKQPMRIGSLGRLHPQKGYDLLIEAIAHLLRSRPELHGRFTVTILGDGPERDRLENMIDRHQLQQVVHLPGATDDVRPFLQSLHLYVQPSRYEGMCLAGHEAMSAGLPIVASPVGELLTSIRASAGGILLGDNIVASCADTIEVLLRDPQKLLAMGRAAKTYVEATYGEAAFKQAGQTIIRKVEAIVHASGRHKGRPKVSLPA